MLQKGCECREKEMEKEKQNWDEVFMDKMQKKMKCHKMFKDKKG
jgi:hypothetical protein